MEFNVETMMDFKGVFVVKCSFKYTAIFHSGISVVIEKTEDLLQVIVLVPPMFQGMLYHFISWNNFSFMLDGYKVEKNVKKKTSLVLSINVLFFSFQI